MNQIDYAPKWQFTNGGIGWYKVQLNNGEYSAVVQVNAMSRWKRSLCAKPRPSYLKAADVIEFTRQRMPVTWGIIPWDNLQNLTNDNFFRFQETYRYANTGIELYAERLSQLLEGINVRKIRLWYGGDITDWERLASLVVYASNTPEHQFCTITSCIPALNKFDLWLTKNRKRIPHNLFINREYTPTKGNMYMGRLKTIRYVRGHGEEELLTWPDKNTREYRIHENAYSLVPY